MSESDHNVTISVASIGAGRESVMSSPSDQTRRAVIFTALATGMCMAACKSAAAATRISPAATSDREKLTFSLSPRGSGG